MVYGSHIMSYMSKKYNINTIDLKIYSRTIPNIQVFLHELRLSLLRLAIAWILRSEFGLVVALFAVCCSSFVPVNRGTGARSLLTPLGDMLVPSVRRSNKLMSRTGVAST